MQLEGLASSDFERIECAVVSEFVHYQPLLRCANAARQADTSQEGVGFVQLMLATLGAHVAIVLLVEAVKFGYLLIVGCDGSVRTVGDAFENRAPEIVTTGFDSFVLVKLWS